MAKVSEKQVINVQDAGNEINAKGKTALIVDYEIYRIEAIGNNSYTLTNNNDIITINNASGIKYIKKPSDADYSDFLSRGIIYNAVDIPNKKGKFTGTKYNDEIVGTDEINDIKGNDGNDTIIGSIGADKLTGGKGENKITYNSAEEINGDIVTLTKSEKLTIDISAFANNATYKVNKNNFEITAGGKTLTIANFGSKDVTNNGTKKVADESYVKLVTSEKEIDLRTVLLDKLEVNKNYTGTWHADNIDASAYENAKNKGLTIDGKAGNDVILGSKYDDTLKAGTGIDTITGGKGNDKLYAGTDTTSKTTFVFSAQDGSDTIYSGKGEDTLQFNNTSIKNINLLQGEKKNSKDLIIRYNGNENDVITVKNYFTNKNTIKNIKVNEGTFNLSDFIIGSGEIAGTDNNDIIKGSANSDTISAGLGDDNIYAFGGNDTYIFNTGDGIDTINYSSGNDIIKFNDCNIEDMNFIRNNDDIEIHYGEEDVVTLKGYATNTETIKLKDSTNKNYTLILGGEGYTAQNTENNIIIGSVGTNTGYSGNSGDDIFVSVDGYNKFFRGYGGKNTYIIKKSTTNSTIISTSEEDKIILSDINFEDDNVEFSVSGRDSAKITYKDDNNNTRYINLVNYMVNQRNLTAVDLSGTEKNVSEELNAVFGSGIINGHNGKNEYIYGSAEDDTITSGTGNDLIYSSQGGIDTFIFRKGDGNDNIDAQGNNNIESVIKFTDTTYEDLEFDVDTDSQRSLIIKYNNGSDSVRISDYFVDTNSAGYKNKVTKFMVQNDENIYSIDEYNKHTIANDGESEEYTGTKINDVFTSSNINETFIGLNGKNIYNFTTGSIGSDTIVSSSNNDIINFSDVEVGDLTFNIVDNDVEITKDTEKVVVSNYMNNLNSITVNGVNNTTTTLYEALGITVGSGEFSGTINNDKLIGSEGNDTITAGKGNDIINGRGGDDTYIFNTEDGIDAINYTSGNDVIKFNDVKISEMTFVRVNDDLEIHYGVDDVLTLKNYAENTETVKIKDSEDKEYTLILCGNTYTAKNTQNNLLIGASNHQSIGYTGNNGDDIFVSTAGTNNAFIGMGGSNTYIIKKATTSLTIKISSDQDKIILSDINFNDDNVQFVSNGRDDTAITFEDNGKTRRISLLNFKITGKDITVIDSTGEEKSFAQGMGIIWGNGTYQGTEGNDYLISNLGYSDDIVSGMGGIDDFYTRDNSDTVYTYKAGEKNTAVGSYAHVNTYGGSDTVYAQSETNIIEDYAGNESYFAYIDQKTNINDGGGNDTLTLTNTFNTTDGAKENLHLMFNVTSDYDYDENDANSIFKDDIIITSNNTKESYDNWKTEDNYKGISIVKNAIETINSSDGYALTNANISALAETVAEWLTNNGYASVDGVFANVLGKEDNNSADIATLTAQFDNINWQIV